MTPHNITSHCTLLYCTAIESSTLHGRHTCGSRTVMSLLMKTRQGLEGIRDSAIVPKKNVLSLLGDLELLNSSVQQKEQNKDNEKNKDKEKEKTKSEFNQMLLKSNLTSNYPNLHTQSDTSESLDNMLLEMCKHLEEQNILLEGNNEELRNNLKEKENTTVEDIIPHYRLAIIRYVLTYVLTQACTCHVPTHYLILHFFALLLRE